MLTLEIKTLEHAIGLELPKYETELSAGMDLRSANLQSEPILLKPMERIIVPTGLSVAIPKGFEAQIRPRSGLAFKHGITVLNSPGTIDADYRGEIKIILINLGSQDFTINRGERIAQMVIAPVSQAHIKQVNILNETLRNDQGFGSTGTK